MERSKNVRKKSLLTNYFFNFSSQIITLLIPLITTPYLARVFHEVGNGKIAFANTIVSYFTMLANLGFTVYGQREIAKFRNDPYKKSKIFWEIIIIRTILVITSFSILSITTFSGLYGSRYTILIFLFGIQIASVLFDLTFLYQGEENFKALSIRTLIMRLTCLICVFVFIKTENDIDKYALIYSLSFLLSSLLMWFGITKRLVKIKIKDLSFKRHILPSFIIFLPTLAVTVYGSLDKIMIGFLSSNPDYDNGCYNQAFKLNQTVLILVTVIDSIFVSRNSYLFANDKTDTGISNIYLASSYVWRVGLPLIVGSYVLAANLSSWYLGNGFVDVPILFRIMSVRFIVSGFSCVFGNQLFVAIGKEKYTTIAHIITAVSNLILNFIFIPKYGAIGGAITTAISEIIDFLVLTFFVIKYKYLSMLKIFISSFNPLIASTIMLPIIYYINLNFNYTIFSFITCVLLGGLIYCIALLILKDKYCLMFIDLIKSKLKKKNKNIKILF